MISKTKINKRMKKKKSTELAEAIYIAKKNNLNSLAEAIAVPTRQQAKINLEALNKSKKDSVIVPGKVLSGGNLDKKIKVYVLGISAAANEKLKKSGSEFQSIIDALKSGEKIEGEIMK